MKNKIKKKYYLIISFLILTPLIARAQVIDPENLEEKTNLPHGELYDIIENIMLWLLSIVGIVGVIAFSVAGLLYLTSAGNENRVEQAKKAMLYAIVGVIVALAGLVIIKAVMAFLNP